MIFLSNANVPMTLLPISTVLPPQKTFVPSVPLRLTMCNQLNLCATTLPLHTLLELGQTLSNRLPVPLTVSKSVALPSLRLKFAFSTHIKAVVNRDAEVRFSPVQPKFLRT